ncbi:uncharacterized protein BX664DRAFT_340520 [Halteromyces radiatus]|uniref:uncharacterized protein n=1 Tax=Halteromyces radiatus TaxID=101107 RepID=UPI0022208DD2|nr:uncharacterized protein BX664DRAFT_340520 [Halteromyces radiatus]KAI8081489.1 hypothetical protein BX664DRAFT_340520 [Halteromyces radiatus]
MSSNSQYPPPPPQVPTGWLALWDETAQRYYYVDQSTGVTQWEHPSSTSSMPQQQSGQQQYGGYSSTSNYSPNNGMPNGEAGSYMSSGNNTGYPSGQPPSYGNVSGSTSAPGVTATQEGDRGLGSMLGGFMKPQHGSSSNNSGSGFPMNAAGGALAGTLLTLAAGKLSGKQHSGGGGLLGNLMGGGHQQVR